MRFDEILTAHGFMRTERPPLMWEADTDDERFIPLLGEMIVVGLNAGTERIQLTLAVSNVTVEEDEDPEESPSVEPGDYVAVTVTGAGSLEQRRVAFRRRPDARHVGQRRTASGRRRRRLRVHARPRR
jgi:hypothetical protein